MSNWSSISGYSGINQISYRAPLPAYSKTIFGVRNDIAYRSPLTTQWIGQLSGALTSKSYRMQDSLIRTEIKTISTYENKYSVGWYEPNDGNPLAPCLRMDNQSTFRFRCKIISGVNNLRVNVKQVVNLSPRPCLYVNANPSIGVVAASGAAPSGNGWVIIGPVIVTGSGNGAVWVELRNNYDAQLSGAPCYWDHFVLS